MKAEDFLKQKDILFTERSIYNGAEVIDIMEEYAESLLEKERKETLVVLGDIRSGQYDQITMMAMANALFDYLRTNTKEQ